MFKYFVNNIDSFKEASSYEDLYNEFVAYHSIEQIDKYEFRLYCRDLENKSLLSFSSNINEYGSSVGYIVMEDYDEVPGMTVTSMGEKFAQLLEDNPLSDEWQL